MYINTYISHVCACACVCAWQTCGLTLTSSTSVLMLGMSSPFCRTTPHKEEKVENVRSGLQVPTLPQRGRAGHATPSQATPYPLIKRSNGYPLGCVKDQGPSKADHKKTCQWSCQRGPCTWTHWSKYCMC